MTQNIWPFSGRAAGARNGISSQSIGARNYRTRMKSGTRQQRVIRATRNRRDLPSAL
jgi:hypothetical protein